MAEPLTRPEDLTGRRLAGLLDQRGSMNGASVVSLTERGRARFLFSIHARFDVEFASSAAGPPSRLLLKLPLPESSGSRDMVAAEARFYRAYGDDPALPLVRWLAADDHPEHPFLLIEDLSDTHFTPPGPVPASRRHTGTMVQALARFHARWWEHPTLGVEIGERWDEAVLERTFRQVESGYLAFRDLVGDAVSPERHSALSAALSRWPRLARRLLGPERLTLIHGDAHAWNCLFPRDPDRHPAYLVDLSTWRIRTPANDLAYMMAVMWFPDVRRRWELPLLRQYHEQLVAAGVHNYSWEQLWWDYRFAVIIHLFTPVLQAVGGTIPQSVWWYNLERVYLAFEDLDCRAIL